MPRMIAVSAAGLCRRYGRRWALVDVSFDVPEGAVVMVAGRNGSGKSTLLRTLATAIRPDRGSVRILGRDAQDDRYEVRETIALLDHYTYLYEPLSALDDETRREMYRLLRPYADSWMNEAGGIVRLRHRFIRRSQRWRFQL